MKGSRSLCVVLLLTSTLSPALAQAADVINWGNEVTDSWRGPMKRLDAPLGRFQNDWQNIQANCPEGIKTQLKLKSAENPTRNLKVVNEDESKWDDRNWANARSSYSQFYEPFESFDLANLEGASPACQSAVRNAMNSLREGYEILWRIDDASTPRGAVTPQLESSPREGVAPKEPFDAETQDLVKDVEMARVQMTDVFCSRSEGKKLEQQMGQIQGSPALQSPLGDAAMGGNVSADMQRVNRAQVGLDNIARQNSPHGDCGEGLKKLQNAVGNLKQHLQRASDPAYRQQVAQTRAAIPRECTTFLADASSSMGNKFEDKSRMEHLKGLFNSTLGLNPASPGSQESFLVFGQQGLKPGAGDCSQVGPLDPSAPVAMSREDIVAQANGLKPSGSTPMSLAVLLGAGRFSRCESQRIVLLTDGGKGGSDGCRKDFCEAIRKLQNAGKVIEIDFIHYREIRDGDPLKREMDCVKRVQAGTGVNSRIISGDNPAAIEDLFGQLVNHGNGISTTQEVSARLANHESAPPTGKYASGRLITSDKHFHNVEVADPEVQPAIAKNPSAVSTATDAAIVPSARTAELDKLLEQNATPVAAATNEQASSPSSVDNQRDLASNGHEDPASANQILRSQMPRYDEVRPTAGGKLSPQDKANEDVAAKARQSMAPGLYEGYGPGADGKQHACVVLVKQQGPWYFSKGNVPMVDISVYDKDDLVRRPDGKLAFKNGEYVQVSFGQRGGWTAQGLANEYTPAELRAVATNSKHPVSMPALHATGNFSKLQTGPSGASGSFSLDVQGFYYRTNSRAGRYLRDSRTIAVDFSSKEKLQLASRQTTIKADVDRGELRKITVQNMVGAALNDGSSGQTSTLDKGKTCDKLHLVQRFEDATTLSKENQNVDDLVNHQSN
ncbi:MAG: VWA domain-containing protein [Bdellovibrionales bacterium]|nr:VWA domain-containing protein [Bdellovibrionales bacterium]